MHRKRKHFRNVVYINVNLAVRRWDQIEVDYTSLFLVHVCKIFSICDEITDNFTSKTLTKSWMIKPFFLSICQINETEVLLHFNYSKLVGNFIKVNKTIKTLSLPIRSSSHNLYVISIADRSKFHFITVIKLEYT